MQSVHVCNLIMYVIVYFLVSVNFFAAVKFSTIIWKKMQQWSEEWNCIFYFTFGASYIFMLYFIFWSFKNCLYLTH